MTSRRSRTSIQAHYFEQQLVVQAAAAQAQVSLESQAQPLRLQAQSTQSQASPQQSQHADDEFIPTKPLFLIANGDAINAPANRLANTNFVNIEISFESNFRKKQKQFIQKFNLARHLVELAVHCYQLSELRYLGIAWLIREVLYQGLISEEKSPMAKS